MTLRRDTPAVVLVAAALLLGAKARAQVPVTFARSGDVVVAKLAADQGQALPDKVVLAAHGRVWTTPGVVERGAARIKVPDVRVPAAFVIVSADAARQKVGQLIAYPAKHKARWDEKIALYASQSPPWFDQWAGSVHLPVRRVKADALADKSWKPKAEKNVLILGRTGAGKAPDHVIGVAKQCDVNIVVLEAAWFGQTKAPKKALTVGNEQMAREFLSVLREQKWPRPIRFDRRVLPWDGICNRWAWITGGVGPVVEEIGDRRRKQRIILSYVPWHRQLGRGESAEAALLAILHSAAERPKRTWRMAEMIWPESKEVKAKKRPVVSAAIRAWAEAKDAPPRLYVVDLRGKTSPPGDLLRRLKDRQDGWLTRGLLPLLILGQDKLLEDWKWAKINREKERSDRQSVIWLADDKLPPDKKTQLRLMQVLTEQGAAIRTPTRETGDKP